METRILILKSMNFIFLMSIGSVMVTEQHNNNSNGILCFGILSTFSSLFTYSTSWGQWEVVMNRGFLMEPVAKLSILALIFVFLTTYICSFHGGELGRNWKGGYFQICINSKQ